MDILARRRLIDFSFDPGLIGFNPPGRMQTHRRRQLV